MTHKRQTKARLRSRLIMAGALLGPALAGNSRAATYTQDFNTDPTVADPTLINGTAKWVATGGVNNTGYISLTDAVGSQGGGFLLPDLDAGAAVGSILLNMKLWIGPGAG